MSRFVAPVAALLVLLGRSAAAVAQDGTPPPGGMPPFRNQRFADTMGLPELQVTATDTACEGIPAELAAGRYVVTLTNQAAEGGALEFVELTGAGKTVADIEMLAGPTAVIGPPEGRPEAGAADGTPMAGTDGSPIAAGPSPFDWLDDASAPGGVGAFFPGQVAQPIVAFTPGAYAAYGGPETPQAPVAIAVTGDAATAAAGDAPAAGRTVTAAGDNDGYRPEFAGELAPGQGTIEVSNDSDQPRFLIVLQSPVPVTIEQLAIIASLPEEGPVPEGVPNPEEWLPAAYAGTQSVESTRCLLYTSPSPRDS